MASPNRFTPLGDDEISNQREDADAAAPPLGEDTDVAATPLGSTDPRAPTLGWDAFVGSLEETAQRELGVVDDILISYANFAGEAFRGFDIESARVMDRIIAMEDALEFDHDEVVQTSGSLSDLKEIVLANATGLSNINTMMKENATTVAALRDIVDATSTQVKTMAAALRDVTETANTAFRLASGAQPTIDGHGVRLNALVVDVSKMSSDIDGLRASHASPTDHTSQLTQLEGTVSRIDSEFIELRKLLERQTDSNVPGDSRTMPTTDASVSRDSVGLDHAQRKSPFGLDDVHPLFPHADPAYRTPRQPQMTERARVSTHQVEFDGSRDEAGDSTGPIPPPRQAAQGSRPPDLDSRRAPFWPVPPPRTSYQAGSYVPTPRIGNMRQHMEDSRGVGPLDDDGQYDDDDASLGGIIISPRNADRRRQALAQRISPFDVARLGNARYHGGSHGYQPLTEGIIHRCGYTEINSSDVLLAYNDIIEIHSRTCDNWEHPRGHYKGPQLERILEKGIGSFPRLSTLAVEQSVEFYDAFQKTALIYLLPVMPFDCICIKMGFEALCPPGLGIPRYAMISRVLMELLPRLLPRSDTQVSSLINMVRMDSGNGYDLLWRVMALSVPGFDPTLQVKIPAWDDDDIFDFALSFLLYFRLQAKKGVVQDDRTHSISFLTAVTEPAYADAITTLITCITNYTSGLDDGYLPLNLCIMGLASQLHTNARTRAHAVIPRVRRTLGMSVEEWDRGAIIQGSPRVARLADERSPFRDSRGGRGDSRQGASRPFVQGGRGNGRTDRPSRGRFTRPDRNDGPYRPDTICDACRRTGHVAANCDVLAIALFIEKYKRDLSNDVKDKIETDWVARWRSAIGNPTKKPRRVMKTYLDLLDITMDDLDDQMCWDCWPESNDVDDVATDTPSE
jgi:hypothetical protein